MTAREFIKMHGLGNDFVVIDARQQPLRVAAAGARALADRHTGVGFDQLITLEPASEGGAAAFMRIHNADGGEVDGSGEPVFIEHNLFYTFWILRELPFWILTAKVFFRI